MALYYLIDDDEELRYEEGQEDDLLDYCISSDYFMECDDDFEEWFNETEGTVYVADHEFEPAAILKELDYSAYREELSNWADNEAENAYSDARYELRDCSNGDHFDVCNYTIYVYSDDEEEEEEFTQEEQIDNNNEILLAHVNNQLQKEQEIKNENSRLEDAFMAVFQKI